MTKAMRDAHDQIYARFEELHPELEAQRQSYLARVISGFDDLGDDYPKYLELSRKINAIIRSL